MNLFLVDIFISLCFSQGYQLKVKLAKALSGSVFKYSEGGLRCLAEVQI